MMASACQNNMPGLRRDFVRWQAQVVRHSHTQCTVVSRACCAASTGTW